MKHSPVGLKRTERQAIEPHRQVDRFVDDARAKKQRIAIWRCDRISMARSVQRRRSGLRLARRLNHRHSLPVTGQVLVGFMNRACSSKPQHSGLRLARRLNNQHPYRPQEHLIAQSRPLS